MILTQCDHCGDFPAVSRIKQSMTAYQDPESNDPGYLCDDCMEDYRDYWQWMRDEYYRSVI